MWWIYVLSFSDAMARLAKWPLLCSEISRPCSDDDWWFSINWLVKNMFTVILGEHRVPLHQWSILCFILGSIGYTYVYLHPLIHNDFKCGCSLFWKEVEPASVSPRMQEMSDKLPPLKSYVWELGFFPVVVEHQTQQKPSKTASVW